MDINQLMMTDVASLAPDVAEFRELHCEIIRAGNMAADACIIYAYKFKEMRDSKKYRAVGCETFGEYCETVCNLSKRQIYNYISVVEKLDNSILQSSALSMSKLITLASMNGTDRAELLEENGLDQLEDMTSKELINLKAEHEARVQQLTMDIEKVDKENDELRADAKKIKESKDNLDIEVSKLKIQPTELKKELDKIKSERDSFESKSKKLAEEIKTISEAEPAVQIIADTESVEKLKTAEQQLENTQEQLKQSSFEYDKLLKKYELESDKAIMTFSVKFRDLQSVFGDLIELLGKVKEEKQEHCRTAIKAIIEGWEI